MEHVPYSAQEWRQVLASGLPPSSLHPQRLRKSVLLGLPAHLRGAIWPYLSRSQGLSQCFSSNVYARLLRSSNKEIEEAVARDVYRTFPSEDMFGEKDGYGQRGLMNVLKAYAAYDPQVGYCQGMGFVVGMLLIEMYTEEDAFWQFVQIMQVYSWRCMFQYAPHRPSTPRLLSFTQELANRLLVRLPALHSHLETEELSVEVPFTPLIMTIFACGMPHELAVRVMDAFLIDGEEGLFVLLLRMLEAKEKDIVDMEGEALYVYLKSKLAVECFQQFSFEALLTPFV